MTHMTQLRNANRLDAIVFFFVVSSLALLACAGCAEQGSDTPEVLTSTALCVEMGTSTCDQMMRCFDDSERRALGMHADKDACLVAYHQAFTCGDWSDSNVCEPGYEYDPEAGRACLQALEAQSCDEVRAGLFAEACQNPCRPAIPVTSGPEAPETTPEAPETTPEAPETTPEEPVATDAGWPYVRITGLEFADEVMIDAVILRDARGAGEYPATIVEEANGVNDANSVLGAPDAYPSYPYTSTCTRGGTASIGNDEWVTVRLPRGLSHGDVLRVMGLGDCEDDYWGTIEPGNYRVEVAASLDGPWTVLGIGSGPADFPIL